MKFCMHFTPGVSAARVCGRCRGEHAIPADDVSRIVNLYGSPDRDVLSGMADTTQGAEVRSLEYFEAHVLFTFMPEDGRSLTGTIRWKLLLVNDTLSGNSLPPWSAAARFYAKRT